jgi:hypothetical protein
MSKKNTRRREMKDMIVCPFCKAYSYPRVYAIPNGEEEAKAILCGACMMNLRPYIDAMMKYEEKMKETLGKPPTTENALILDNGDSTDIYVDSEKVMNEVLTEMEEDHSLTKTHVDESKLNEEKENG